MAKRYMYDSLNVNAIPAKKADVILAYMDLSDETYTAAKRDFPRKPIMTITRVGGTADANAIDIEPNVVWPIERGVAWLKTRIDAGHLPIAYMSQSNWQAVKDAVAQAGLTEAMGDRYLVAAYPGGGATIPAGAIGHQYEGDPGNSPGDYDVSVIRGYIPGFDPPRKPTGFGVIMTALVKRVTRRLNNRSHPLNDVARALLEALVKAANRVLRLK